MRFFLISPLDLITLKVFRKAGRKIQKFIIKEILWLLAPQANYTEQGPMQPANFVPTFAGKGSCVGRTTDPYGR
jgi:hypothetical protein